MFKKRNIVLWLAFLRANPKSYKLQIITKCCRKKDKINEYICLKELRRFIIISKEFIRIIVNGEQIKCVTDQTEYMDENY
jgi:hypothetical protein